MFIVLLYTVLKYSVEWTRQDNSFKVTANICHWLKVETGCCVCTCTALQNFYLFNVLLHGRTIVALCGV